VNWLAGSRWLVAVAALGDGSLPDGTLPPELAVAAVVLLVPLGVLVLLVGLPALLLWVLWDLAHLRRPRIGEFLDFHS